MSLQVSTSAPSNLPGRVAMLALATGLGFLLGAGAAPLWGNEAVPNARMPVLTQPAPAPISFSDEAAARANQARLEPVLVEGQHVALQLAPDGTVAVVGG